MEEASSFHPGAAKFGNFINYYSFNPADNRIKLIPSTLLSEVGITDQTNIVVCLDIGCNSGELTTALYSHLAASFKDPSTAEHHPQLFFLGIDRDSILITRCKESNQQTSNISFQHMDITQDECVKHLNSYLKKLGKDKFDLVTCFSVTMWIHLNHGDDGLYDFLKKISSITTFLLLEPQDWKCYKSAVRRMKRLKQDSFDLSCLRHNQYVIEYIDTVLESECGMKLLKRYGETSWSRELKLFHKS